MGNQLGAAIVGMDGGGWNVSYADGIGAGAEEQTGGSGEVAWRWVSI